MQVLSYSARLLPKYTLNATFNPLRSYIILKKSENTPTGKASQELENAFVEIKDAKVYRSKGAYESALQLYNRVGDIVKNFGSVYNPMLHALHRQEFETYYEWNKVDKMKELSKVLLEDSKNGKNIHEQIGDVISLSRFLFERKQIQDAYSLLLDNQDLLKDSKITASEYLSFSLLQTAYDHFKGQNSIVHTLEKLQRSASQSSSSLQTAYWNCIIYNNLAGIQYEQIRSESMDIQIESKQENSNQFDEIHNLYKQSCQYRDLLLKDISLSSSIPESSLEAVLAISLAFTNYGHFLTLMDMKKEGGEMLKSSLKLIEKIPDAKNELSRILGYLAFISFKEDQPVMSEGLYSTSLDTYKSSYKHNQLLLQEIHDYADILKNYGILLTKWDQREKNGENIIANSYTISNTTFYTKETPLFTHIPTSRIWIPSIYKWNFNETF